ncbi:MAG TPA: VWA domain-containing protein, partial [Pirellulaceae bacterium]|nr:VWA domain-containing protein [Pirellulaceae bacterium]
EETNLKCTILLDASKSMRYGGHPHPGPLSRGEGGKWSKFDYAATAAASLAYLLQQQQDAVGLVTFTSRVQKNLPPSSHPNHLKLLLHELEQTEPDEKTDVAAVFPELARQIRRRGMIVLLSDLFLPVPTLAESLKQFRLRRHEVIVFHVMDNDELTFPFEDNTLFRGLEEPVQLHTEPRALRRSYLEAVERFLGDVRKTCATAGVDYVLMNTKDPLDAVLGSYLTFRQKIRRTARHH